MLLKQVVHGQITRQEIAKLTCLHEEADTSVIRVTIQLPFHEKGKPSNG